MAELPSGSATLVFTDIEGSTRLLAQLGDAYEQALLGHQQRVREVFGRHGGVEVNTFGDSFFYAFGQAAPALHAASELQQALAAGPVRVRIGLHTGEPQRSGRDYVGMDVHRAARIMAAGHGGQVLVSESTSCLVRGLPRRDLGEHRLKDLAEPIRVYQLGEEAFPPLRTLSDRRSALPVPTTPLVGRERELEELEAALAGTRLLTLTGPGGTGKTRLALELAASVADNFADGVVVVPLAGVADAELVMPALMQALSLREQPGRTTEETLEAWLSGRDLLLVLDNLEHVLEAAPSLGRVLGDAPRVKVVATCRAPLQLTGEREYAVPPLDEHEAVSLFAERARAVRSDLELTAENEQAVREICGEEQRLFRRVSVFLASFDLDAAEAVCGGDVTTVASLVEKSLVRTRADGRFSLLQTIREYAAEQLGESGEADELRSGHLELYCAVAGHVGPQLVGPSQTLTLDRLACERENIQAAVLWGLQSRRQGLVLRLLASTWRFWWLRGPLADASWIEEALELDEDVPPGLAIQALNALGSLRAVSHGAAAARQPLERSLAIARRVGDDSAAAHALLELGHRALEAGDYDDAERDYGEATEISRRLGRDRELAACIGSLGYAALFRRDYPRARKYLNDALDRFRRLEDEEGVATTFQNLGLTALRENDPRQAADCFADALRRSRRLQWPLAVAYGLEGLAALAVRSGDAERAARLLGASEHVLAAGGAELEALERELHDETTRLVRDRIGEEAVETLWSEGRALSLDAAVAEALTGL